MFGDTRWYANKLWVLYFSYCYLFLLVVRCWPRRWRRRLHNCTQLHPILVGAWKKLFNSKYLNTFKSRSKIKSKTDGEKNPNRLRCDEQYQTKSIANIKLAPCFVRLSFCSNAAIVRIWHIVHTHRQTAARRLASDFIFICSAHVIQLANVGKLCICLITIMYVYANVCNIIICTYNMV